MGDGSLPFLVAMATSADEGGQAGRQAGGRALGACIMRYSIAVDLRYRVLVTRRNTQSRIFSRVVAATIVRSSADQVPRLTNRDDVGCAETTRD